MRDQGSREVWRVDKEFVLNCGADRKPVMGFKVGEDSAVIGAMRGELFWQQHVGWRGENQGVGR